MKQTIIFSAFMVFVLASVADAQVSSVRVTFSESINPATNVPTGSVVFQIDSPPVYFDETIIPVRSEAECFASRDFSNARPVSPDRATLSYDATTGLATLKWNVVRDRRDTCRVLRSGRLFLGTQVGVYVASFGGQRLAARELSTKDGFAMRGGTDGSVRPVNYSISTSSWDSRSTLGIKYPGQANEIIEAQFPDSPSRHFLIFEGVIPATTDAGCLANTDFTSLLPADPNRTTMSFSPATGTWFLKNSNSAGATPSCRVVLADGDGNVDASDYAAWRTNFGSGGFTGENEWQPGADGGRPQPTLTTPATTYVFRPVLRNQ